MDEQERLTSEDLERADYLSASHLHRYELATRLCRGLRVLDLCCGTGYGSALMAQQAAAVHGVDIDPTAIAAAQREHSGDSVSYSVGDALAALRPLQGSDYDAIVCFEGLEHVTELEGVVQELERLASDGTRMVLSVPNSRAFGEENRFHHTDFSYPQAREMFARFPAASLMYQYFAEGSLIVGADHDADVQAAVVAGEREEVEYANTFIAAVGFEADAMAHALARMNLTITPAHNRYMLELERANDELFAANRRLIKTRYGQKDAAAAGVVAGFEAREAELRAERDALREQVEDLRDALDEHARALALERAWRDAPRYHLVDAIVGGIRRVPLVGAIAGAIWRALARRRA